MKITCIYLAAGNSRRFGSNKLFYEIDEKPMYRHLLERLAAIAGRHDGWEVLVVSQYPELLEGIRDLPVRSVLSPESEKGIAYSIRAGILAAERNTEDSYAFFTADQPFLREETAEAFLLKMEQNTKGLGCVSYEGETGNPTWFSGRYRNALLALEGDRGGKRIILSHPEDAEFYEIKDPSELQDVDQAEDIKNLTS